MRWQLCSQGLGGGVRLERVGVRFGGRSRCFFGGGGLFG